ncbi:unnamed protein product [Caenorhabditis nigoni]
MTKKRFVVGQIKEDPEKFEGWMGNEGSDVLRFENLTLDDVVNLIDDEKSSSQLKELRIHRRLMSSHHPRQRQESHGSSVK